MRRIDTFWVVLLTLLPLGCGKTESTAPTTTTPPATRPAPATQPASPATTQTTEQNEAMEGKLFGTWIAEDVDAKLGEVKIKLTFRKEGPMNLAAWSDVPFVGQVRDKTGPFKVEGNVISSDAIRGGTSVEFWFEEDDLIIRYKEGKTVRFQRA